MHNEHHQSHESEQAREHEEIVKFESGNSYFLSASILTAGILIAGSVLYSTSKGTSNPAPQPTGGNNPPAVASADLSKVLAVGNRDIILGDQKAPVTLIEYGDYQCPFCGKMFTQVEPQLREEYIKTGKVKMVYRNFQFLGAESTNAGASAECAKDQGKFWVYHDELYKAEIADGKENSGNLNRALFVNLAEKAGLDANVFASCYDNNKYVAQIEKDKNDASAIGVNATPTNYINGQMVQGAQPYAAFKSVIDLELTKK